MLLGRPYRDDQARIAIQVLPHLLGCEVFQQYGPTVSRFRVGHWELAAAALVTALALWLSSPSLGWGVVGFLIILAGAWSAVRERGVGAMLAAGVGVAAAAAALSTSLEVRAVERRWPEVRESLIARASARLDATLAEAVDLARDVARRAAMLQPETRGRAFELLSDLVSDAPPEHGVVILDSEGVPWSWGGRHRVPPRRSLRELSARITPFYVVLEARRQSGPRTVVSHVVLAADSAVPDRGRTVASRFTRETAAALEFFAPGAAPSNTDVFDYCLPACAPQPGAPPPDTLFSVRAVPPAQGTLKLEKTAEGARWTAALAIGVLGLLVVCGGPLARWGGVLGVVALLVFSPAGERLGLAPLFSSAFYFVDVFGPLSASAGALGLVGAVLVIAVVQLGRPRARRPRWVTVVAGVLVVGLPYGMWTLAQGITPPSTGEGLVLWLSWQVPLAVIGAAVGLWAAALLERPDRTSGAGSAVLAGVAAAGLGVVGVWSRGSQRVPGPCGTQRCGSPWCSSRCVPRRARGSSPPLASCLALGRRC